MLLNTLRATSAEVRHTVRAKYYVTPDGVTKLAKLQQLSFPSFRLPGFEEVRKPSQIDLLLDEEEVRLSAIDSLYDETTTPTEKDSNPNAWKNLHRAKVKAFDKILCNHDLDTFVTFTISPSAVSDRASWHDVYRAIEDWLKNRVRRRGLKYVMCPERHKKGGIHLHAVMNASALSLIPATNAHTGEPLMHNGQPLYNVTDWPYGFSSAERIQCKTDDREHVAKYIFKYMGKQGTNGRIGGRYALSGGKLETPIYLYGDDPREFIPISEERMHQEGAFFRETSHEGITYREWSFI